MRIEDLAYLLSAADRPGRSLLRVNTESQFIDTGTEGVAPSGVGTIVVNLGAPAVGFVRLWTFLTGQISTDVATDAMFLGFINPTPQTLLRVDFTDIFGGGQVPLVGGLETRSLRTAVLQKVPFSLRGLEPMIVGSADLLRVTATVTAASGQTCIARGRYVDLPI